MLLKGEQLAAHLERELKTLYVLYGDDPLLILEAADLLRAKARSQGFSEREVLTALPGFDWNLLTHAGGSLSLFGDRKIVDLRIPSGKPGKEGSAALQAWCQHQNPDTLLLVTLPELDWKEEKAAWMTALTQAGVAVKLQSPPLAELPGWLAGRLRRQQQSTDPESLRFIAERVEGNLLAAHQELQKLGLLYPPGALSPEQIRAAVLNVARYDLDTLREALLQGDTPRLMRTLEGLRHEGEAPPLVLWSLAEEIRALALVKGGQERGLPLEGLLKEAKVWGPRQNLIKRALTRFTHAQLLEALAHSARVDRLIKGLGVGDVWEEFQCLCLRLAAPARPKALRAG